MEAQAGSSSGAGSTSGRFLSDQDADELLVITGQIRRLATMPGAHRLLRNALSALEELRERVTRPAGYRSTETLGDQIVEESHPY